MFNTLRIMSSCTDKRYSDTPFEELAALYQNTNIKDRDKSSIVRTVFCRLFPMLLKLQSTFAEINNDTKIECIMSDIHYALLLYGTKQKPKCKFTTYLYNNIKTSLLTYQTKANSHKRCVWRHMIKNNDDGTNYFISTAKAKNNSVTMSQFIEGLNNATLLSSEEKDYCKCVLYGYIKSGEIEHQMNYSNRFDTNIMTNPNGGKKIKRKSINDIKKSIKAKFEKYDRKLFV